MKIVGALCAVILILTCVPASANENQVQRFGDIPAGHWADKAVHELRRLNITDGVGGNLFGFGKTIKRCEFMKYLVSLMQWELVNPEAGSFSDNQNRSAWYYRYIETALAHRVLPESSGRIRPDDPITREEMAIMLVNALGYNTLAGQLATMDSSFTDVTSSKGFIAIAKDFGIITGYEGKFRPNDTAKREEAAAMMMRMYERLHHPVTELHAFYAISSFSQVSMIDELDSVSFGWSRLEYDVVQNQVVLNTTRNNMNEYAIPNGFSDPIGRAKQNGISTQLMIAVKNDIVPGADGQSGVPLAEYVIGDPVIRRQVIESIVTQINNTVKDAVSITFDGVVIDFEGLRGEKSKLNLNAFLVELKAELEKTSKKLYVAVHPKTKPGRSYYDGYDYKTIGDVADKVILMAHDYYAKKLTEDEMKRGYTVTPLTPFDEVYYSLQAITDPASGVGDPSKIWLQISFDAAHWMLKDGAVVNQYPSGPSYDEIYQRILSEDVTLNYSNLSQNPNIRYYDNTDRTDNVVWYEDSQSVQAKITLAKMFGITGVSIWRLGAVPDKPDPDITDAKEINLDVWQQILSNR